MSLEKLREEGLRWVEANKSKRFSGVTKLLTDLYPDNAHFIYELLQNAEDARNKRVPNSSGASVVRFTLSEDALEFEHNGEGLFTLEDVGRITGIGDSAKRDDPTSIGKFGIGFKAVFAYTNTPEIHSGEFHFRILDLVVPETNGVKKQRLGERETRFIFPFDHPKKLSAQAVEEVERGLRALGDNTLLFLSYIRKIEYLLPDGSLGSLERIDHEGGHIEIRSSHPGGNDTISHWLRFQKDVEVVDEDGKPKTCRVAIAYNLVEEEDKKKRRSACKIIPLEQGQVSIYFPAEKETSNLRFHLHAPFASTVARDSVRDCKANHQLRDHLADLVVESLSSIRDQGMLTVGFLAVLPNPGDNLSTFYEPIRKAIVHAFQNEPLTPTKNGAHTKADGLYRGPAKIAEVLNDDVLSFLTKYDPPLWAANPPQQNQREDRFLDSLEIDEWGWSELSKAISKPHRYSWQPQHKEENDRHKRRLDDWLTQKDDAWLMRLYALLGEACDAYNENMDVNELRIARVETNKSVEHVTPGEAFFPPDDGKNLPPDIHFIKPTVYSTGRSETQKKYAASFLKNIGVRPFDAKAMIELRLVHYKSPPKQIGKGYYRDLKQFIAYWKENTSEASLFSSHTFLVGIKHDNGLCWCKPETLCLDIPYFETGLVGLAKIHGKYAIWNDYQDKLSESQLKDFITFLKAIGTMYELKIELARTNQNPHARELRQDYNRSGVKWTNTAIDQDYSISSIDKYIAIKSIPASRLIWDALIRADAETARARFRPNRQYSIRVEESQLVYHLKSHPWIPNKSDDFLKPQDMTMDDLRTDFPFNDRNGLLTAIGFGENAKRRSNEYSLRNLEAKKIGFASAEEAEKYAELAKLVKEGGKSLDELIAQFKHVENKEKPAFPTRTVSNPDRRQERFLEQLSGAKEKEYEQRERSVRTTGGTVDPVWWLRNQYTNEASQLFCQICKKEMPFRKRDGEYYFEKIEALSKDYFSKEHEAQFLALCPLCAARYNEFVKQDRGAMETFKNVLLNSDKPEVSLQLGNLNTSIRFVESHFQDIKTILAEQK